jgi:hypothetical protein
VTAPAPRPSRALAYSNANKHAVWLLVFATALYVWNAMNVPFGTGYDEFGHAAYIHAIVENHELPLPFSGWNTFHPPLYYLLSACIWSALAPWGPLAVVGGIKLLGALSVLVAGAAAYFVLQRSNFSQSVTLTSVALLLTIPFVLCSGSWIGNEALVAGVSSLACLSMFALIAHGGGSRHAVLAGILCGLTFDMKYTGLIVISGLVSAAVDVVGRRVRWRAVLLSVISASLVAAPVLARNVSATGRMLPMTRDLAPVAESENKTRVSRSVLDYLPPALTHVDSPTAFDPLTGDLNIEMKNVWALTYASAWYDPFSHRLPTDAFSFQDVPQANTFKPLLLRDSEFTNLARFVLVFGLIPTLIMMYGFAGATVDLFRGRLKPTWTPLVVMSIAGLCLYIVWTWTSATLVAVKASYLTPLLVPAAAFFARGLASFPTRWEGWVPPRPIMVACCLLVACASALTYAEGAIYRTPLRDHFTEWKRIGSKMPSSGILETMAWWEGR